MIITDKEQLRKKCKDVSVFEAYDIISKLENELDNLQSGVGLAANQIGIDAAVAIIRTNKTSINLVNPVIIETYDLMEFHNESCLSFPGDLIVTKRFNEIFVQDALHPAGMVFTGIESVIALHEIGHLNGELMYDFQIEIPQRNQKCWCQSKRKYKKCCLRKKIK